jgi:hypothetical protein
MSQKISIEDAFPTFQKRCRELFEANLLLEAKVDIQGRQIDALREENARLQQAAPEPEQPAGPDLAAQPPYPLSDTRS